MFKKGWVINISMDKDSRYYYGLGLEAFEREEIKDAIMFFRKSLELSPHFKTYERMYHCLEKIGKLDEAKEYIEKAFNSNPHNDKVAVEYITVLVREGNTVLSTEILNNVLTRNPNYGPALRLYEKINETL